MSPLFLQLVVGALLVLGAVAIGVSAILNEQKRRRCFLQRLARVSSAYARANPLTTTVRGAPARSASELRLIEVAGRLFGYDPVHAEHYPLRWWAVLGIAFVLARGVAVVAGFFAGAWSLLIVPVAWVLLSRFFFEWSEQRRRNALYAQFPDALAMIVRAVRVGIPLSEGIRTVAREAAAPTKQEFALLYDRVSIGVTLRDALHEMAERNKLSEYRFFATALALQSQTGGGLTEALEGLADVIRRRLALKERGLALAAEAKMSIIILAALPFVVSGVLAVINPRYLARLVLEPGGQKLLMIAVAMLSSGLLTMRVMINKALS